MSSVLLSTQFTSSIREMESMESAFWLLHPLMRTETYLRDTNAHVYSEIASAFPPWPHMLNITFTRLTHVLTWYQERSSCMITRLFYTDPTLIYSSMLLHLPTRTSWWYPACWMPFTTRYQLYWGTVCRERIFSTNFDIKSLILLQTPTWEAIYPRQLGFGCAVPGRDCGWWVSVLCMFNRPYCACVNNYIASKVSFWKRIPMLSLVVYPSHVWMLPISRWANSRSSKRIRQQEND